MSHPPRFQFSPAMILALTLTVCSCTRDQSPDHTFSRTREAGIIHADNTGGPKYPGELFTYERIFVLEPDITQEEAILYRPESCLRDESGRLYLCDTGDDRIAVFSADGRFLRSIGSQGDGPGCFQEPRLRGLQGDILRIWDIRLNRMTLFRTDGTLIEVVSHPAAGRPLAVHRGPTGGVIIESRLSEIRDTYEWIARRVVSIGPDGDTLMTVATPEVAARRSIYENGLGSNVAIFFSAEPVATWFPPYGIFSWGGEESIIRIHDPVDGLRSEIRLDLPGEEVTSEDRRRIRERYEERLARAEGIARQSYQQILNNLTFTRTRPPWADISVDSGGFLWLLIDELDEEREAAGGRAYRVLSPAGEYLGDTRRPALSEGIPAFGHLVVMEEDPLTGAGLPAVYRIRPAVRGLHYP